jgi:hypothetical protein
MTATHDASYLPPKGDVDRKQHQWGPDPEWWQPVDPAAWAYPLPVALPSPAPRKAKARAKPEDAPEAAYGRRWWRDEPYLIRYDQPVGDISRTMVEARLMRALAIGRVYAKTSLRRQIADAVPQLAMPAEPIVAVSRASAEAFADWPQETASSDGAVPLEPTPDDIGDWITAMSWFAAINPPELWHSGRKPFTLNREQRVLVWRALDNPLKWRQIAARIGGRHWTRAAQIYNLAIDRCHRVANGKPAFPHRTIRDQLVEIKERNRAFKRAA